MQFATLGRFNRPTPLSADGAYLEADNWDDYGWKTAWTLWVVRGTDVHEIGSVKIGDTSGIPRPKVPERFSALPYEFFSLGQGDEYYDNLNQLGDPRIRHEILAALRDVALDLAILDRVQQLEVTKISLLRSVRPITVRTQLHRIALGGAKLSPYSFSYKTSERNRDGDQAVPAVLHFEIEPTIAPKSNVHVIIGRNGVGKSHMLHDITTALTKPGSSAGTLTFHHTGDDRLVNRFTNVVSVAFSAFDAFEPPRGQPVGKGAVSYTYIGLKTITKNEKTPTTLKNHVVLASQFGTSLKKCVDGGRLDRWQRSLEFLKSDPLFADSVDRLLQLADDEIRDEAREVFGELSSGHKIVLLTLTKLVETVEEATLVLLDEPESHLHPPLLSAFMGSLTELLESRNAAAIIVTHSPVVVQEVPSNCVWKISLIGGSIQAKRPTIETYGENVGTLTQEIFGLEVTASGFHRTLAEVVGEVTAEDGGFDQVLERLNGRLGAEARALVQSMVYFAER
ncbi:AAA family ATPase [Nocardia sp. PE-7]|uniref:AAA family ATPase n=1 Tax=Nocardia sp. PE-7 TaxID=3058426 RepID=UPI002658419A|nr:AAA family ATPase [Nocardia sp. PE-7]WKG11172.1 AAA family ATPase [Nocardia sp. PE-7]